MSQVDKLIFLDKDDFTQYNRSFARLCGHTCAIILSELIGFCKHFQDQLASHPKHGDGWFYATIDKIEYRTGISRHEQDTAIKKLINLGLIETVVFGLPGKRYFRIDQDAICRYFGVKIYLLDCRKSETSNNNFKESNEEQENCGKNSQKKIARLPKIGNYVAENRDLGLINNTKEPKEEPKENTYAPPKGDASVQTCSSSKKSKSKKPPAETGPVIHPAENLTISVVKHEKLVKKYGAKPVEYGYAYLSEWKIDNPNKADLHTDYGRMNDWAIKAALKQRETLDMINKQNIAPHRRNSKLVTPGDYENDVPKFKRF